jgi:hypothetical protein
MGFNRRKMEARRAAAAKKEAAARRATEAQILEDAGRLVAVWNERQVKRMPMLFSPTIGCALKARHWCLWVRCRATLTLTIDLRHFERLGLLAYVRNFGLERAATIADDDGTVALEADKLVD